MMMYLKGEITLAKRFILSWETGGVNREEPLPGPRAGCPEASQINLFQLVAPDELPGHGCLADEGGLKNSVLHRAVGTESGGRLNRGHNTIFLFSNSENGIVSPI